MSRRGFFGLLLGLPFIKWFAKPKQSTSEWSDFPNIVARYDVEGFNGLVLRDLSGNDHHMYWMGRE